MNMPFYVAPEQIMKDRADYARKGIARGKSLVGLTYADGILLCAENLSNHAAQDQRDLRPDRVRRGGASTTSSTNCASPACVTPT